MGHFMCLIEFEAEASEIEFRFDYNMHGSHPNECEGMCAYILDTTIQGWDTKFDGRPDEELCGPDGDL